MKQKLPQFLYTHFWEANPEKIDIRTQAYYIIERILEYGDTEAVQWMLKAYQKNIIIDVLKTSRALSLKSANYWAIIFNTPKSQILCFSKQFRKTSRAIWNY